MTYVVNPTVTITSPNTYTTNTTSPWITTTTGTGTGNINWGTNAGYTIGPVLSVDENLKGKTLSVKGDADFEGDVTIKGKNIVELIENIERRLAILHPNEKLEAKWEKLKALGDMYRELEAEIIEKEKMWAILKK